MKAWQYRHYAHVPESSGTGDDAGRTGDIGTEMMNVAIQSRFRIRIKKFEGEHRSGKQETTGT